jgi:ATP-binding cassette, subfamily F, member 3
MSVVRFENLGKSFGALDLFTGLSAEVPRGGRVGLVGPNGVGKTTLLRMLVGDELPSAGTITRAKGTYIGYLEQEAALAFGDLDHTVYEEMLRVFDDVRAQEAALRRMEGDMAEGNATDELLNRYGQAQEAYAHAGGYEYELSIAQTLTGLGFDDEAQHMPLAHCSGGQKTRALLARLLLEKPDLLVLDEPTNHLDIEAVAWLEGTLQRWDGALLVVSHDRYFLDQVINVIWEMGQRGLEVYRGNYSAYLRQRDERWALRAKEFEQVHERFLKQIDFVKRNIVRASTTDRAKGVLKRLAREVQAVEAGGTEALNQKWSDFMRDGPGIAKQNWGMEETESHIRSMRAPNPAADRFRLRLATARRGGDLVLRAKDVEIGFPETPLFHIHELLLQRNECAALIGANGTGKSTFLRTLRGELPTLKGELRIGANLDVRYFAQAYDILDENQTVLEELLAHQQMGIGEARDLLARYLFRKDDIYKPMRALSGGERGRFALMLLALHPVNFLLLDEPTNHLDIHAQEILEDALANFPGTVLLVSHDRYLIDRLATQVWELRDDTLRIYPGNYTDYLAARQVEQVAQAEERAVERETARAAAPRRGSRQNGAQAQAESLLTQIGAQEVVINELAQALADAAESAAAGEQSWEHLQELEAKYRAQEAHLAQLLAQWEQLEAA